LISDSGVGFSVAATRQNAGTSANALPPPRPPPPAGANAPAATLCASVIVASGNLREERLSHDAAETGSALKTRMNNTADKRILVIVASLGSGSVWGRIIAADSTDYTDFQPYPIGLEASRPPAESHGYLVVSSPA